MYEMNLENTTEIFPAKTVILIYQIYYFVQSHGPNFTSMNLAIDFTYKIKLKYRNFCRNKTLRI